MSFAKFLTFLIVGALFACSVDGSGVVQYKDPEIEGWNAVQAGDFGRAVEMVLPRASAGDPEAEFAVGDLALLWLEAEAPKEPPRYTLQEAMDWIRRAAAKNLPQAAGVLRSGYEWGRYALPKNPELEECWRAVEGGSQQGRTCLIAEEALSSRQR